MDEGILLLETLIGDTPSVESATVGELVVGYRRLHPDRPVWHLTDDVQRQAMVYANIVDGLKSGRPQADIRIAFEQIELVPPGVLPNPDGSALAAKAFACSPDTGKPWCTSSNGSAGSFWANWASSQPARPRCR
jgi:hypothetical protein